MEQIYRKAEKMQKKAWRIIKETQIIELWRSAGATINLVGSLKTGLLLNNRDIDFHIYTDPFSIIESFSVMAKLAENSCIRRIYYTNLLEAEDKCIEWHAFYEDDEGETWQIDLIHILNKSPFAGYFEKVANNINMALTDETRDAILRIKYSIPGDKSVMGIQIYRAVIEDGVRDIDSFMQWKGMNNDQGIITWMPLSESDK